MSLKREFREDQSATKSNSDGSKQFFAIGREDGSVRRFEVQLKDGNCYSVPYALLPIYSVTNNNQLKIITHDIQIQITGKNLSVIYKWLHKEALLFIRESSSGIDIGKNEVFITSIEVFESEF